MMTDWEKMDLRIRMMELHHKNSDAAIKTGLVTLEKYKDVLIKEQEIIVQMIKELNEAR